VIRHKFHATVETFPTLEALEAWLGKPGEVRKAIELRRKEAMRVTPAGRVAAMNRQARVY
jgi:hypothetical protein